MTSIRNIPQVADFGFDLLRNISASKKGENVFLSPTNIAYCLAMTSLGAAGDTFVGMNNALRLPDFGDMGETTGQRFANLTADLMNGNLGVKLRIANSIWASKDKGVSFSQAFLDANKKYFNAEVRLEDFNDPATVIKINESVKRATEGGIDDLVKEIGPNTVMFLVSAIYLDAGFKTPFDEMYTRPARFMTPNGEKHTDTMFRTDEIRYSATADFAMTALPFGEGDDKRFSLFTILPVEGNTAENVVQSLTKQSFFNACRDMQERMVTIHLPKIGFESEVQLKDSLADMGMAAAFSDLTADFSRMSDNARLAISKVTHKVAGQIDEKGAKVVAATVVEMVNESCFFGEEFRVNRPYVTAIVDESTGAMPLLALVNNPEEPKA